ncbi:MAG: helix-turn-helix domain-containing protein [Candidatus Campbellbacteria bacterium]|nr:helix-turn-helix domain-containing protein [Candidatus Campbellbacteria bacterium]
MSANKIPKKKSDLKWYTFDEVFKKRGKEFERGYRAESARIMLAETIRKIRISKNLTQADVAKRINMPQSVIARLEGGKHSVSVVTLDKVAHALGRRVQLV